MAETMINLAIKRKIDGLRRSGKTLNTLSLADSLEGRLVAEAVLATLHNESEARVDVLGGLFLFKRSEKVIEINGWYILLVGSSDHYEENLLARTKKRTLVSLYSLLPAILLASSGILGWCLW